MVAVCGFLFSRPDLPYSCQRTDNHWPDAHISPPRETLPLNLTGLCDSSLNAGSGQELPSQWQGGEKRMCLLYPVYCMVYGDPGSNVSNTVNATGKVTKSSPKREDVLGTSMLNSSVRKK